MTTPNTEPQLFRPRALATLTNYILVSGLLACVAFGVTQLGTQFMPAWHFAYLPVLCFLAALEAAYMTRYLRYHTLPVPWYVLRGFEAVVIFLMLRSLLGVLRGPQPEPVINPFYGRVDDELAALTVSVLLTWLASWRLSSDLLDLEAIDPAFDRELINDIAEAQLNSRQSLITFTLVIGAGLAFFAGLVNSAARTASEPAVAPGLWHVVVYFLLALTLFSRTRLSLLRASWTWEKMPVGPGVGGRWLTYTLALLGLAVIIAVLLPTQYSLGLLGTLGYLLSLVIVLVQIIIYLIGFLLGVILSLFAPGTPDQAQPKPLPAPFALPGTANLTPPPVSEFVQSLIFWGVFFIIAGYMLAQFLHRHPEIVEAISRVPGMGLLLRAWRKVRAWFGGLSQQLADLREARRQARRDAAVRSAGAPRRFINPRRLSPRQQVQFFYLAMLRRSGERGHPRQATQTPHEYARALHSQLPEVGEDITAITDEFSEARYSRHEVTAEKASLARRYWDHIKRALRR